MSKLASFGSVLEYCATSGGSFVPIAAVRDIAGPAVSVGGADATSHDSTEAWEESVPTVIRSGEIGFEIAYDPDAATHKNAAGGLLYLMRNRTVGWFKEVWPGAASARAWLINGYINNFNPKAPVDGVLTADISIKPTGPVTFS